MMSINEKTFGKSNISRNRFTALMLTFAMIVAGASFGVFSPLTANAAVDTNNITSWGDLKTAIEDENLSEEFIIAGNLYADETITIPSKVTLKGKDDKTYYIFQKQRDKYDTMFKVSGSEGDLTLGKNLVLSGKTAKCQGGASTFNVTWSNGASGTDEKTTVETLVATDFDKNLYQTPGTGWSPANGFTFNGWKWKNADGSTGSVEGPTAFETHLQIPSGTNGDAKIVAQWVKKDFKVIWSNGVSGDGEKTETWSLYDATSPKPVGTSLSFTPPDTWKPSNEYRFAGWTYRLSGDTTDRKTSGDNKANIVDGSGNPVKVTADSVEMKIVAIWEKDAPSTNKYIENGEKRLVYDYLSGNLQLQKVSKEDTNTKFVVLKAIDSNGLLTVNVNGVTGDQYVNAQSGNLKLASSDPSYPVMANTDISGTVATISSNPIYLKYDWGSTPRYFTGYGTSWSDTNTGGTAMAFTLTPAPAGSGGGGSSTETYSTTITPSYSTPDPEKYTSTVEPTYNDAPSPQTCDGAECAGAETYTKDTFASGRFSNDNEEASAPHGFFVQVEDGAKATLAGATLEDFITSRDKDKAPKNVAPVTVIGKKSRFDVSGGKIRNNIVGYVVIDGEANKNANSIKMYVKGAAPNASRKEQSVRRNKPAGIDDGKPGSGVMGTAGAIIYSDETKGTIKGGSIEFNRGDTGGIMATGTGTVIDLETGTNINNNVGVQFGGGVTTENDASINMHGGSISENVAWFGGGGVFATENGTEWLRGNIAIENRKDGKFVMNGDGVIDSNTAFTRGGGFLVDSDGVSLIKGTIRNNMSRMIGGGMYVMGDHKDFTYTVFINQGYVHDNKAVSAGQPSQVATDPDNQIVSRKLVPPNGCDGVTDLFNGQMEENSDDTKDGYPWAPNEGSDGTGGGIWLCAYGNTVLGLEEDQFIIDHNYASGSVLRGKATQPNKVPEDGSSDKAGGNDIHKETKGPGSIVITGITEEKNVDWYDENNGEWYTDPAKADAEEKAITDYSIRNLTNRGSNTPSGYTQDSYEGVDVYGNISRRGGGLAADGTFMFGKTETIGDAYSELAITKTWTGGVKPEDVKIRVNLEYKGDDGSDKKIEVIELLLSELVGDDSELGTTFTDGSYVNDQNQKVYKGHIVLPIVAYEDDGKPVQMFDLLSNTDGSLFDMTTPSGLLALAKYIEGGGSVTLSNKERKLTFVELVKKGDEWVESEGFEITPAEMRLCTDPAPSVRLAAVYQPQTDGSSKLVGTTLYSDVFFEADLVNDKPSEIEKYVNKAVHKDISLDEEFEYDIMAYVKHGTDKLVLTDKLTDVLDFVSGQEDVSVVALTDGEGNALDNNHKPVNDIDGKTITYPADDPGPPSVSEEGVPVENKTVEIDSEKKELTVTIKNELEEIRDAADNVIGYKNKEENQNLTALWGKWVKVTYRAQLDPQIRAKIKSGEMTLADLESDYVTVKGDEKFKSPSTIFNKEGEERPEPNVGNDPVKSKEDHRGIENTASYSLEVKNEPAFKDESNTVTVKPEQPEIEKYVNQAVHHFIDIGDTFTYDIIAYITKDADEVTITDELDPQLQFESAAEDIAVVDLGEEDNHKVTNDINAKQVNKDASVAEKGRAIDEKTVSIAGNKLTVKLDDEATVKSLRGHWVKVTFDAKIKDGLTSKDLKYTQIDADAVEDRDGPNVGNAPVLSDESHNGVPNKAAYTIGVRNDAEMEEKHKDESNTVTVKPKEYEIQISKKLLGGGAVPGAKLTVLDSKGAEVASWTTDEKPHKLMLKPGSYVLKETSAPAGLKQVTASIKFKVNDDGTTDLKTKRVDNDGKIGITGNHITLENAPVEAKPEKYVGGEKKAITVKSKDETIEFIIAATVPYGVTKFEIGDDIPKPLLYVEDSLEIFVDDDALSENASFMTTEDLDYVGIEITSENDGTTDVSKLYGRNIAISFKCRIDTTADLTKYGRVVNTAYVFLNGNEDSEPIDAEAEALVLGIDELADMVDGNGNGKGKGKSSRTGDIAPIALLVLVMTLSMLIISIVMLKRRRAS